jgi:hypothetical protein
MKNKIPFKCSSMCEGYNAALLWINAFNRNFEPKDKIRKWNVEHSNNFVILKF